MRFMFWRKARLELRNWNFVGHFISNGHHEVSSRSVYLPHEKTSHPQRHCARITCDSMLHCSLFLVEEQRACLFRRNETDWIA